MHIISLKTWKWVSLKNKRFLLVHPEISRTKYNFAGVIDNEPLELEYIYSMLKSKGYEPDIWDGQVEKISLEEKVRKFRPAYLYVCGRTRQENFMKEYCACAKKICGSTTIIGGLHAQKNYRRFFKNYIDFVVTTFDIERIADAVNGNYKKKDGICFKEDGNWTINKAQPYEISSLPAPDRTYFYSHMDRYRYLELLPCAHVRTAYCCPYRCSFCSRNKQNCGKYTTRDIEDVVDEIENIRCENIYIIDDDFLFDEKRIIRFIKLIKEKNIRKKYVCYGRADFIASHPKIMKQLKEIGFYYVLTGLEAVNDSYLEAYNKRSDMSCNTKAVKIMNETGINIMGMFITDLDFDASDFRKMYKWIVKNNLKHTAISIFTPEMSSELMEQYRHRLITKNPAEWDYLHVVAKPGKMSVKEYYFHYHILLGLLFIRGWRDGIYDFLDYGFYLKSILKNMFRFGG